MQKTEPTWSAKRVEAEAEKFYNKFVEEFQGQDPASITSALIKHIAQLTAVNYQIIECLTTNGDVSNGAFENSHLAVQKFQELEATMKSQGRNFSERLERLESRKRG